MNILTCKHLIEQIREKLNVVESEYIILKNKYENKFQSTAGDHVDIFLEDNLIVKFFEFMNKQNNLIKDYDKLKNNLLIEIDHHRTEIEKLNHINNNHTYNSEVKIIKLDFDKNHIENGGDLKLNINSINNHNFPKVSNSPINKSIREINSEICFNSNVFNMQYISRESNETNKNNISTQNEEKYNDTQMNIINQIIGTNSYKKPIKKNVKDFINTNQNLSTDKKSNNRSKSLIDKDRINTNIKNVKKVENSNLNTSINNNLNKSVSSIKSGNSFKLIKTNSVQSLAKASNLKYPQKLLEKYHKVLEDFNKKVEISGDNKNYKNKYQINKTIKKSTAINLNKHIETKDHLKVNMSKYILNNSSEKNKK